MRLDDSAWPSLRMSLGVVATAAEFDVMTAWYAERPRRAHAEDADLYVLTDAESTRTHASTTVARNALSASIRTPDGLRPLEARRPDS